MLCTNPYSNKNGYLPVTHSHIFSHFNSEHEHPGVTSIPSDTHTSAYIDSQAFPFYIRISGITVIGESGFTFL